MNTTRRDLLRATAATAALALPVPAMASSAAAPDVTLLQAEAEWHRLVGVTRQLRAEMGPGAETEEAQDPYYNASDEQEEIIAVTPPATLAGVLVKLRRLADPNLGIDGGVTGTGEEGESLRQCVVFLERLAVGGAVL